MNVNELNLKNDFLNECLLNVLSDGYNFIVSLIESSENSEEFIRKYLDKDTAVKQNYYKTQGYQEMLKAYRPKDVWYYCREMIGDKCRETSSDMGALKVGNDSFSALISNGYGDGVMRYAVLKYDEFYASSIMKCQTMIQGIDFYVYSYDCGNDIDAVLDKGRYLAYSYDGIVVLVALDND